MGSGGQKNGPPGFLCFIDPKGPTNKKSENECKILADRCFCDISTRTTRGRIRVRVPGDAEVAGGDGQM